MRYRQLGNTGITVSEIGFGCWGIGGLTEGANSYGPTDDKESERALRTALDQGVTFYDTSDIYGNGHSEELLGAVFHDNRHDVVIASKFGYTAHEGPHDLSPAYLRRALEGTLRRLRTDYLDLYQVHSPEISLVKAETVREMQRLVAQGKVRAIGFSVKHPDNAKTAIERWHFPAVQANFSMLDQRIAQNGAMSAAALWQTGIIARTPFNFGFLAKKPDSLTFSPHDHRSRWPREQLVRWAEASDRLARLNEGKGRTLAQFALQFCLTFQAVSSVIPGILHPEEVMENVATSELPALGREELAAIDEIRQSLPFVGGKA